MKFCTKCGNEMLDEAVICTKCGCMVEKSQHKEKIVKENNANFENMYGMISFIFGIVSFICAIFVFIRIDSLYYITPLSTDIVISIAMVSGIISLYKSNKKTFPILGITFAGICLLAEIISRIIALS